MQLRCIKKNSDNDLIAPSIQIQIQHTISTNTSGPQFSEASQTKYTPNRTVRSLGHDQRRTPSCCLGANELPELMGVGGGDALASPTIDGRAVGRVSVRRGNVSMDAAKYKVDTYPFNRST